VQGANGDEERAHESESSSNHQSAMSSLTPPAIVTAAMTVSVQGRAFHIVPPTMAEEPPLGNHAST
jgi:hypothetical protein